MKNSTMLFLFVICFSLMACVQVPQEEAGQQSKLAISSVRDMPVSYEKGSSFALAPKYVKETSLKPEQTQKVYRLYADAIVTSLQANGYQETMTQSGAKFHVGFGIALADDLSDKAINKKFGVSPGLPESEGLNKGSFLVYIEDVETGKKVWRGAAQGFAHQELTLEQRKQRAANIVESVMKQFYATN